VAVPAWPQAQVLQRPIQQVTEQAQARYQITVMEAVLERAVENAARVMNSQVQPLAPNLMMFGSVARARGFRLDGYGVFFDVEVPMVRQSLAWSFRITGPPAEAIESLRQHVRSLPNSPERQQLDLALRQIEVQFPARQAAESRQGDAGVAAQVIQPIDPSEAYTNAVTAALMDAMLDYSGPLKVNPDEWLAVAARDYEGQRGLDADVPYDLLTIVLRIKGSDLTAFRTARLTRDEARKRIEVKEF
jgi:hypothetical protein